MKKIFAIMLVAAMLLCAAALADAITDPVIGGSGNSVTLGYTVPENTVNTGDVVITIPASWTAGTADTVSIEVSSSATTYNSIDTYAVSLDATTITMKTGDGTNAKSYTANWQTVNDSGAATNLSNTTVISAAALIDTKEASDGYGKTVKLSQKLQVSTPSTLFPSQTKFSGNATFTVTKTDVPTVSSGT